MKQGEFIVLMAAMMSLTALSIDALLPALQVIGDALGSDSQDNQLMVTMIFVGIAVGQLVAGPVSDSLGRKPVIYVGYTIFALASLICVMATNLEVMVAGRILQGIGLSAPRTICIAIIRDRFSGDRMARIMSFISVFFIIVPAVAPLTGKIILEWYHWHAIFYSHIIFGGLVVLWFKIRQPETLNEANKIPLTFRLFTDGAKEFLRHRRAVIFTVVSGLVTGAFMVFLSTSQHVFEVQYDRAEQFPYIFAGLSLSVGVATFINGRLVMRFGMKRLIKMSLIGFTIIPIIYTVLFYGKPNPSLPVFLFFLSSQIFTIGFLFGNLRAYAMEPIGHIAGVGAAINGFFSTLFAVPLATAIGSFVDTTTLPMFIGFFVCGVGGLLLNKMDDQVS